MKKMDTLVKAVILLTVLLSVCTVADFLALHDVNKDYVSQAALQYLEVTTSKELPAWTGAQLEWATITVSYLLRTAVIVLSLLMLFGAKRELRKHQAG
jgi:hypothetical protein